MSAMVIGSRASRLALWQANWVRERLEAAGHTIRIEEIRTSGDRDRTTPLAAFGGRGIFVREIEERLLAGSIDLAVHSLKDLPTSQPDGLTITCIPRREDPRDLLAATGAPGLSGLRQGAVVGTGSPRRACQILARRPDLRIRDLRGNVDTRIDRLKRGDYDAIVLAMAGVRRLGLQIDGTPLEFDEMLPAVGQGALALEVRAGEQLTAEALTPLHHAESAAAVTAERAVLRGLGGGCLAPIAAVGEVHGEQLTLRALVADPAGRSLLREERQGAAGDADAIGLELARRLLDRGAAEVLTRPPVIARDPS